MHWSNLAASAMPPDVFSIAHVMGLLLMDALLYFTLAWYIEAVFPGQYGVPKPWYFPVTRSYWCGRSEFGHDGKLAWESCNGSARLHERKDDFEEEPRDLPLGVLIRKLTKVYEGADRAAVNELSLNFYEGQITSFLGHNGAGKTTTISILTGLYPPTSGTAEIYGKDIRSEMDAIRQSLGTCPQYNVLFENLSVAEHLWFYARLKGLNGEIVNREVDKFVKDLALDHKRDEYSCKLSGGMQRKLSVAIAFVGGSQTVILDEPTAGVDPYARRSIWDLLLKYKAGRTVIMTTHHMDEADLLGDRIAVINNGQLRCCGSSLFLKTRFGSGYYLTLVKTAGRKTARPAASVQNDKSPDEVDKPRLLPPNASFQRTNVPDVTTEALSSLIQSHIAKAELVTDLGTDLSYRLPASPETYVSFAPLCEQLDANLSRLGISSYGISDTTLEEVFLRVTQAESSGGPDGDDSNKEGDAVATTPEYGDGPPKSKLGKTMDTLRLWCLSLRASTKTVTPHLEEAAVRQHLNVDPHSATDPDQDLPVPPIVKKVVVGPLLHRRQLGAMYRRRFTRNTRNYKGLFCEIVLPALFVFLALLFTLLIPPLSEEPPLELTPWVYGPPNYVFYSNDDATSATASKYTETLLSPPGLDRKSVV